MCNPVSGTLAALTLFGGYAQQNAIGQADKYNGRVADQNTAIANQQARDAIALGEQDASARRTQTQLMTGRQRVTMAANNVDLQSGTPMDIVGDTALFGAIDESRIRANAAREAFGYETQAWNLQAQKKINTYQSKVNRFNTVLGSLFSAGSIGVDAGWFKPKG